VFKHESPLDPWWNEISPHVEDMKAPTVFWAGWYDIFLNGNIGAFDMWQQATGNKSWLVIDPMGHCQGAHKGFPAAGIFDGRVSLPIDLGIAMFTKRLDNTSDIPQKAKHISFYVMGPNVTGDHAGDFWTSVDEWPATTPTKFYLHSSGALERTPQITASTKSFECVPPPPPPPPLLLMHFYSCNSSFTLPPSAFHYGGGAAAAHTHTHTHTHTYTHSLTHSLTRTLTLTHSPSPSCHCDLSRTDHSYDPTNPVPTTGGNNLELKCGPLDQRPVENRSDVLLFTSDPMAESMAVVGQLSVTLSVSSANVNDTDWTAKLTDVCVP
jgi:predicted acyl esterase